MSDQAQVKSLETLREFRAALIMYQAALREAAEMLLYEGRRGIDWVQNDRPSFWPARVRRLEDSLVAAKQMLEACEARKFGDDRHGSCIDEKKAIVAVKNRLDDGRQKVRDSRTWRGKVQKDSDEFETRVVQLGEHANIELSKAIAAMERIIEALESYVEVGTGPEGKVFVPPNKLAMAKKGLPRSKPAGDG